MLYRQCKAKSIRQLEVEETTSQRFDTLDQGGMGTVAHLAPKRADNGKNARGPLDYT